MERKIPQEDHFPKQPIFFGTKDGRFAEVLLCIYIHVLVYRHLFLKGFAKTWHTFHSKLRKHAY
jgi:hypothetical protein